MASEGVETGTFFDPPKPCQRHERTVLACRVRAVAQALELGILAGDHSQQPASSKSGQVQGALLRRPHDRSLRPWPYPDRAVAGDRPCRQGEPRADVALRGPRPLERLPSPAVVAQIPRAWTVVHWCHHLRRD